MTLYEEQELAMVDHHGNITHASDFPTRGCLVIIALTSLTTDMVDITNNDNFHVVLSCHSHVSSVETLGNGHFTTRQKQPIDHVRKLCHMEGVLGASLVRETMW